MHIDQNEKKTIIKTSILSIVCILCFGIYNYFNITSKAVNHYVDGVFQNDLDNLPSIFIANSAEWSANAVTDGDVTYGHIDIKQSESIPIMVSPVIKEDDTENIQKPWQSAKTLYELAMHYSETMTLSCYDNGAVEQDELYKPVFFTLLPLRVEKNTVLTRIWGFRMKVQREDNSLSFSPFVKDYSLTSEEMFKIVKSIEESKKHIVLHK